MDTEGNLRVVGRLKEIIMHGGSNVYPAEVEQVQRIWIEFTRNTCTYS